MSKKENYITIVLFFAFICAFSIAFWIVPDKAFSDNENRYLNEAPSVSGEKIVSGEFMEDWEDYVSDQFPARDAFMELGVRYKYTLGMRDFNGVFVAEDGYLLSVMDRNSIDSGRVNLNITSINLFLDKCGANEKINNVSFMLVPDAAILLADKLPKGVDVMWEKKLMDDIRGSINCENIIYPENEMLKTDEQLYYYTDHHWTGYGAMAAYKEYCKALSMEEKPVNLTKVSEVFYGSLYSKVLFCEKTDVVMADTNKADVKIVKDGDEALLYDFDMLEKKDKYLFFEGGNYGLVEIEGTGEGVLVILKDSFANSFVPFLTENYEKIVMVDLRYYMGSVAALCENQGATEVLVLYSLSNFVSDENMIKLGL